MWCYLDWFILIRTSEFARKVVNKKFRRTTRKEILSHLKSFEVCNTWIQNFIPVYVKQCIVIAYYYKRRHNLGSNVNNISTNVLAGYGSHLFDVSPHKVHPILWQLNLTFLYLGQYIIIKNVSVPQFHMLRKGSRYF